MAPKASRFLCQFCALARFDAERGSTLDASVPDDLGLDPQSLAEQMIPDGLHDVKEDWTVAVRPVAQLRLGDIPERPEHVQCKPVLPHAEPDEYIYILSTARTALAPECPRGVYTAAIAIGTMHPHLSLFKPVMTLALDTYMRRRDRRVLRDMYESINRVDTSVLPCLSYSEKMRMRSECVWDAHTQHLRLRRQRSASSAGTSDTACGSGGTLDVDQSPLIGLMTTLFSSTSAAHGRVSVPRKAKRHSAPSAILALHRRRYQISGPRPHARTLHADLSPLRFEQATIPMRVPLYLFPEEVGEYSLSQLLTMFGHARHALQGPMHPHLHSNGAYTHPLTVLFNALLSCKRVLLIGREAPARVVVEQVLAACAFASGCGAVLRGWISRAMPYATLADVDKLASMRGFVAGTKNPRMAELDMWDVLCDCDTGSITVSRTIAQPSIPESAEVRALWMRQGLIQYDRQRATYLWVMGDEHPHASDNLFMEAWLATVQQHASEAFVRYWCQMYVRQFVMHAAHHETVFYGCTQLALPGTEMPSQAGLSNADKARLRRMAMRFEGWRGTPSYRYFVADLQQIRTLNVAGTATPFNVL
ncbi:hypothetical protein MCAP1_001031 [Malassezia caprae]|uniref:Arf3-interacting protein 1 N-terminal domain-containing protein n=1 Tax=Malassezia caprae TaxID=1381934 RepID=A0AAF0IZA5_9BASI|nr:hypothetical protein MCAP1_001031 [Malassezia caprae]